jgi:cell division protein FtsW (lipid II flippase)
MFWNELWNFLKRNIFTIVLVVTLVVAVPWSIIFVLPVILFIIFIIAIIWRVRRQQQKIFEEAQRQAGGQHQKQQSQRTWRRGGAKNEGEVTVVQTEPAEQRVSDEVGEYVDFKEVKNEETK